MSLACCRELQGRGSAARRAQPRVTLLGGPGGWARLSPFLSQRAAAQRQSLDLAEAEARDRNDDGTEIETGASGPGQDSRLPMRHSSDAGV